MNLPKIAHGKQAYWIRIGDGDNYEVSSLDGHLNRLQELIPNQKLKRRGKYGVECKSYKNNNYISFYVGDINAQPIRRLTDKELDYVNYWLNN